MAAPPPPSPSSLIQPHLSPLVLTLTDPSLAQLLHRTHIPNLAALLQPFHLSVDRVTVRSATYDNIPLARFPVHFVERPLPPGFGAPGGDAAAAGGAGAGATQGARARSGSLAAQSAGLAPPRLSSSSDAGRPPPASPSTPFHHPSQAERDELFLDAVGARIAAKVDGWLSPSSASPSSGVSPPPELNVRPVALRPRLGDDAEEEKREGRAKDEGEAEEGEKEGWEDRAVEDLAPWFKELQDEVFARREMVEWETFGWPVGCLLALSTSSPDPLNALSALWDLASPSSLYHPSSYPARSAAAAEAEADGRHEWADAAGVVRFVVLVHDWAAGGGREGWEDAQTLHETIRKTYGLHTALVPLFSANAGAKDPQPMAPREVLEGMYGHLAPAPPPPPAQPRGGGEEVVGLGYEVDDLPSSSARPSASAAPPPPPPAAPAPVPAASILPGADLSPADLTALTKFTRSLIVQSLIPALERAVLVGNEQFLASKRGIGGRLWGAGRNYPSSSPASQSRRLADLAFMLGDYKLAAQVYDSVAKDFKGDRAWRYWGAAVRMSGLSHLLLHPPHLPLPPPSSPSSPDASLALATLAPSAAPPPPAAPSGFDALRAALLFSVLYAAYNTPSSWALVPPALLRAADGIGEEVAAGVVLEAAGLADLRAGGGLGGKCGKRRRYALHMAMAAARYEKCGIKSFSRRCLSQASTLYRIAPSPSPDSDAPPSVASTSLSDPRVPPPSNSSNLSLGSFTAIHTHLHHSLARQAYTVGSPLVAVQHFLQLLLSSSTSAAQPGGDAAAGEGGGDEVDWLDDFALAWERIGPQGEAELAAKEAGVTLPVWLFDARAARVRVGSLDVAGAGAGAGTGAGDGSAGEGGEGEKDWERMGEEMCKGVDEKEGRGWRVAREGGRKPGRVEWKGASAAAVAGGGGGKEGKGKGLVEGDVEAVVGETFHLALPVRNPLSGAFLSLSRLSVETDAPDGALEIDAPGVVELAPGEKSVIHIPIRAASLGTYTLLSLTYRFASLLPVTEPLSSPSVRFSKPSLPLPGKPSTRTPCPLRVKVRGAVPVLSVDLLERGEGEGAGEGLPQKVFAGETLRRRVKVENRGSVPIAELHVLCDRPDLAVVLPSSSSAGSSASLYASPSSPSSSTPSTATIANHLRSAAPTPLLPTPDAVLQPGETLDFEVLCRGEEVGVVDVKWLFAFKAAEDAASETFSTRAVHRMEVYPSLELRTAVQPNPRPGSPYILGVEAYNAGLPASDVTLTSLALISPRWTLSLAPGTSFEEDVAAPLGWQQATTFFIAVDDDGAKTGEQGEGDGGERDEAVEFVVKKVEALLQGKEVGKGLPADVEVRATSVSASSSPSPLSAPFLSSLLSTYNAHRHSTLLTSLPSTLSPTLFPSLFPLLPSRSSAFLLAFYSSVSLSTTGHLLVPLPLSSLGGGSGAPRDAPLRAVLDAAERTAGGGLYEESQRERAMLLAALRRSELGGGGGGEDRGPAVVGVEVREVVQHEFASGPCKAPIRFHVRNTSPTTTLSYTLNLENAASRGAVLAGSLTHTGTLSPLAISTISTQLWIPRAGVHRAGAWRLTVEAKEAGGSSASWTTQGAGREVRVRDSGAGKQVRRAEVSSAAAGEVKLVDVQA